MILLVLTKKITKRLPSFFLFKYFSKSSSLGAPGCSSSRWPRFQTYKQQQQLSGFLRFSQVALWSFQVFLFFESPEFVCAFGGRFCFDRVSIEDLFLCHHAWEQQILKHLMSIFYHKDLPQESTIPNALLFLLQPSQLTNPPLQTRPSARPYWPPWCVPAFSAALQSPGLGSLKSHRWARSLSGKNVNSFKPETGDLFTVYR